MQNVIHKICEFFTMDFSHDLCQNLRTRKCSETPAQKCWLVTGKCIQDTLSQTRIIGTYSKKNQRIPVTTQPKKLPPTDGQKICRRRGLLNFFDFSAQYSLQCTGSSLQFKSTPPLGCKILSWCVSEPHSYSQRNSARLLGFNYPARHPLPSNTVHLPAGSLLPSIPDKPEIAVPLIRFGRKSKKYHPIFQQD